MAFLCGRPGCGRESTATLQIDAVAASVSLVDPRVSREGVALCADHADSTTPPLGWAMNDLRSTARALGHDAGREPTVTATPPRIRPAGETDMSDDVDGADDDSVSGRRMSRRQSILDRVRQESFDLDDDAVESSSALQRAPAHDRDAAAGVPSDGEAEREYTERFIARSLERRRAGRRRPDAAPESRPSRRRDVDEEPPEEEDKFPWHFSFEDDEEPAELQASTPLLSRAFRSTTG